MATISNSQIEKFLIAVGEHCEAESTLFLLGGGALRLLGGERPTGDLDYVGDDLHLNSMQQLMAQIADEMHIDLEAVPIAEFVPLPGNADDRAIMLGRFGNLTVYVFDPYTIALSKLDRGFKTDLEDIHFLIQRNLVTIDQLDSFVEKAIPRAEEFGLDPKAMRRHLQIVRASLQ